jgi:hypothetical protein
MLISEMEAVLRNLDVRVGRIEQLLPTLATKTDLEASERRLRVLLEHLGGSVDTLAVHLSDQMHRLSDLVERLDRGR